MKLLLKNLIILFVMALVFAGCSDDNNSSAQQTTVAPDESMEMHLETPSGPRQIADTNPHRGDYDIVIVDADGWELCMNQINTRYGVKIYDGILWFSFGSFESTYGLSAAYYPSTNTLMVTAHEDYFAGGAILAYSYPIGSNYNNMSGFYHYMEHRYKSAPISGAIVQGTIGGFGPGDDGSPSSPSYVSRENAKGGLFSVEDE